MPEKRAKWYHGGLAGMGAACCTHPLDLLKVNLQTQQSGSEGLRSLAVKIIKNDGFFSLYNGLSASLIRQINYQTTRFAVYEVVAKRLNTDGPLPFYQKVSLAAFAGGWGGFAGTPGDMVNVRMQNDMKLPKEQRRGYKNAFDGLYRVAKEEGILKWFRGAQMAASRGMVMTVGQISCYHQAKESLLATGLFHDNVLTHFTAGAIAAAIAVLITQPMDVLKTRTMNARPGEFESLRQCFMFTLRAGPMAFYKGITPAFVRLAPHTVLLWLFLEQLRLRWGDII